MQPSVDNSAWRSPPPPNGMGSPDLHEFFLGDATEQLDLLPLNLHRANERVAQAEAQTFLLRGFFPS